jgi:hypothetical protein
MTHEARVADGSQSQHCRIGKRTSAAGGLVWRLDRGRLIPGRAYDLLRLHPADELRASRGEVLLSVTERPGARDEGALSASFPHAKIASVVVTVGPNKFAFYIAGDAAFAADGAVAVCDFKLGITAIAHSLGRGGKTVNDSFSLRSFSDAYTAILSACPAN